MRKLVAAVGLLVLLPFALAGAAVTVGLRELVGARDRS